MFTAEGDTTNSVSYSIRQEKMSRGKHYDFLESEKEKPMAKAVQVFLRKDALKMKPVRASKM